MKALRAAGLILFLTSLGLFLGLFFMSTYTLTEEVFSSTIKEDHQEALRPTLSSFYGEEYGLSIPFVNDIKNAIEEVNDNFRGGASLGQSDLRRLCGCAHTSLHSWSRHTTHYTFTSSHFWSRHNWRDVFYSTSGETHGTWHQ